MESQSELVGGEQTVQPLVANQNDQNVKSPVATKRARNPGKDKKYRGKKKKEVEEMDRELKKARAENDDLKLTNAFSNGKLAQAQEDMEVIKGCFSIMKEVVTQHGALINMLQPLVVAGTINQFGATMEPGGLVLEESLAPGAQENNSEQPTPYTADQFPGFN